MHVLLNNSLEIQEFLSSFSFLPLSFALFSTELTVLTERFLLISVITWIETEFVTFMKQNALESNRETFSLGFVHSWGINHCQKIKKPSTVSIALSIQSTTNIQVMESSTFYFLLHRYTSDPSKETDQESYLKVLLLESQLIVMSDLIHVLSGKLQ